MVEQLSPALSAFWATLFMIFILVQRPLKAIFRNTGNVGGQPGRLRRPSPAWSPGRAT